MQSTFCRVFSLEQKLPPYIPAAQRRHLLFLWHGATMNNYSSLGCGHLAQHEFSYQSTVRLLFCNVCPAELRVAWVRVDAVSL